MIEASKLFYGLPLRSRPRRSVLQSERRHGYRPAGTHGARKTTTLCIRYTVMRPDTGVALIDGFRIEAQNRVGTLADTRGFYPHLTARKHIDY